MSGQAVPGPAGAAEVLSPTVTRVLAPNPGIMTGPGTNTYLVGDQDEIAVIDPGPDEPSHFDAVVAAVGERRVVAVLVTHHHADHWPLAHRIRDRYGAGVVAHGHDGVIEPDLRVRDGHDVSAGGAVLTAVHTPGHASDHLCWWLAGERALFTGDHVMSGSTVVIAPPDGHMATYLDSLERTRALAPAVLYPAHGGAIADPDSLLAWYLSHRLEREQQVRAALAGGVDSVAGIVEAVYTDVAPVLHPVARFSVLAHLEKLAEEGEAEAEPASAANRTEDALGGDNPELPRSEPAGMAAVWRLRRQP